MASGRSSQKTGSSASSSMGSVSSLSTLLPIEMHPEQPYWCGIDCLSVHRCDHGLLPCKKLCFGGKDACRRYYGYPLKVDEDQCGYVRWYDPPYPNRLQRFIKNLWIMGQEAMKKLGASDEAHHMAVIECNEAI
ncbi:hypothetical protein QOZ80_8AG0624300 [Eleusine coracana subsp. coracana]|nr:hypothetical protein QOZ80_8AG0624300 [Eleusine coracana subsp. coracana]